MASTTSEIAIDASPLLRIYKDGRIERLSGNATVPPGLDTTTNVDSKDIVYSSTTTQSARLYIPKDADTTQKLPLLVYFHGGGFCIESASSPVYHNFLNPLVAQAKIIAVSVDFRRAPEDPIPAAFEDSWEAVKWVGLHSSGSGPEDWLNRHANLSKVFFAGDSAGANIAHHMGVRVANDKISGVRLTGIILIHPYFWGKEPVGEEPTDPMKRGFVEGLWRVASPTTSGVDDPWINPVDDPSLGSVGGEKILVCVAEKDLLRHRGWYYSEKLKKSEWSGVVEVMEAKDEHHVFHLFNPTCENAVALVKRISDFMN